MGSSIENSTSSHRNQNSHRGRAIKSCLECRRRKMRCSRSQPCQNCSRFSRACVYLPFPDWPSNPSLQAQSSSSQRVSGNREILTHAAAPTSNFPFRSDQPKSRKTTSSGVVTDHYARHGEIHGVAADEETVDEGLQIGRLRITERAGGLNKAQLAKRVSCVTCSFQLP